MMGLMTRVGGGWFEYAGSKATGFFVLNAATRFHNRRWQIFEALRRTTQGIGNLCRFRAFRYAQENYDTPVT